MDRRDGHKLNIAILRLAADLKLEQSTKQLSKDADSLLWSYHKALLEYAETLVKYADSIKIAYEQERVQEFEKCLLEARQQLEANISNIETFQQLVNQVEDTRQLYVIDTKQLRTNNPFARIEVNAKEVVARDVQGSAIAFNGNVALRLEELQQQTHAINDQLKHLHSDMNCIGFDVLKSTADLIQDVIQK